jgi:hypothetical protein
MTFSIMTVYFVLNVICCECHKYTLHAECHYVFMLSVFMLSGFMLSGFMLSVIMLSVFMQSVFMFSVIMLNVLAPTVYYMIISSCTAFTWSGTSCELYIIGCQCYKRIFFTTLRQIKLDCLSLTTVACAVNIL